MSNNLQSLTDKFIQYPGYLEKGAGYLAKQFNVEKKDIYKAKEEARKVLHGSEVANLQNIISEQETKIARFIGSETSIGGVTKSFESTRVLSPEEIKELAAVDDITCRLGMVWNKLQPSGKWTYSIQVVYLAEGFYSKDALAAKMKEIFPDVTPVALPEIKVYSDGYALCVYLADDHVGLKFKGMYGNSYSGEVYEQRMMHIAAKIATVAKSFKYEKMFIVRLGDEADGYNGKTTRYDHALNSESNQKQFDIYTTVNKKFYDAVFSSGAAHSYEIVNCNNSNHSGLGFSYMLNKAVEFYVEARFPQVKFTHVNDFMGVIEWGNHVIGLTHGKDEKHMKRPMPMHLNPDTDLWLYDFYDNKGFSPNKRWISTVKGDLHKYNINTGKSGRYVNCPSISGSSDYIDHNYGNTKPGALMEAYHKLQPDVVTQMLSL